MEKKTPRGCLVVLGIIFMLTGLVSLAAKVGTAGAFTGWVIVFVGFLMLISGCRQGVKVTTQVPQADAELEDVNPEEPPTEPQLQYARRLGIQITPGMGKWDVAGAISDAVEKEKRQKAHVSQWYDAKRDEPEGAPRRRGKPKGKKPCAS